MAENPNPEGQESGKAQTFLFGSAGSYSGTTPIVGAGGKKALRFGDTLKLTAAQFKGLKEKLRSQLVPAGQWAAHKKKVLKGNKPMTKD